MPLSCCSITCTTLSCTVWADAPGYAALSATCGGAIAGYCMMGRLTTASPPVSISTSAITQAKTGRSMKNRGSTSVSPGARRRRCGPRRGRRQGHGLHGGARARLLQSLDDHGLAGFEAIRYQPAAAYRAIRMDHALADLAGAIHHHHDGIT